MPNQFTGIVRDQNSSPIVGADVILYISNIEISKTQTNDKGEFLIIIDDPVESSECKLIITQENKELRSIDNPLPTGNLITVADLKIRNQEGGNYQIKNSYKGGEYYFSSLGKNRSDPDLVQDEFNLNLKELSLLIKKCIDKGINISIDITGSESKIPNTDNEDFLEDGITNNPQKGSSLPEKELAIRRVKYLDKHFTETIIPSSLPSVLNEYNKLVKKEFIISGPEPGKKGVDYTNYQYVSIKATPERALCEPVLVTGFVGDSYPVNYVTPDAKYCYFEPYSIADRPGFNGYYEPYYVITNATQTKAAAGNPAATFRNKNIPNKTDVDFNVPFDLSKEFPLDVLGVLIFLDLYFKNNRNPSFLNSTRPGDIKTLNHTFLIDKKLSGGGNDQKAIDSKWRVIERIIKQINTKNNVLVSTVKKTQITDYMKIIDDPEGLFYSFIVDKFVRYLIRTYDTYFNKISPDSELNIIKNQFYTLFREIDKVAIIEIKPINGFLTSQGSDSFKMSITDPKYNLKIGEGNFVNSISSLPQSIDPSHWSYRVCNK